MEELMQLRTLAEELDACRSQEKNLKAAVQNIKGFQEMKSTDQKTYKEKSLGWGIFCVAEILFMILINNGLNYFLSMSMNHGMTEAQFHAAGGLGYRNIHVAMPVGAVLALPFAFLALFITKKILKRRDRKANERNSQYNQQAEKNNQSIEAQNQAIVDRNQQIAQQLQAVEQRQQDIRRRLQEVNDTFPEDYLRVEVMDFIQQELQTGRARNINQAVVHYEASQAASV